MNELKELGFTETATARYKNRAYDDYGIDLVDCSPWLPQCKSMTNYSCKQAINSLKKIVKSQEEHKIKGIPVSFIKITRGGEMVCLNKKDFYDIIKKSKKKDLTNNII